MEFVDTWQRRISKKYRTVYKRGPSRVAFLFVILAALSWGIFSFFSSFPVFAYLYYTVRPATSQILSSALKDTGRVAGERAPQTYAVDVAVAVEPGKDVSLPEGHYLTIPAIGVDTVVWEAPYDQYETALKRGVWRVPDFASPGDGSGKPMILAAHRFGYLEWSQDFRKKNSFYDLPKLKAGDEVRITWDQRQYSYRVDKVVEGEKIDDYSEDLILYTCKFLVSPVRYFVYAKLVH